MFRLRTTISRKSLFSAKGPEKTRKNTRLLLRENWAIVIDRDDSLLVNTAFKKDTWWHLATSHAFILSQLDGTMTASEVAEALTHRAGIPSNVAHQTVAAVLRRFSQCVSTGDRLRIHPPRIYRLTNRNATVALESVRNCAPIRINWVATSSCDKRCRYCYMDASHSNGRDCPPVNRKAFNRLVSEAAALTVVEFGLTGGEPLLVPDMTWAINCLVEKGFYVKLTTKNHLAIRDLSPLARDHLFVEQSLDSTKAAVVSYLTGSRYSYEEAIDNLAAMRAAKIPFSIKMVVANNNINDVLPMVSFAESIGAECVQFVEYTESLGRSPVDLTLSDDNVHQLKVSLFEARRCTRLPIYSALYVDRKPFVSHAGVLWRGDQDAEPTPRWNKHKMPRNALGQGYHG